MKKAPDQQKIDHFDFSITKNYPAVTEKLHKWLLANTVKYDVSNRNTITLVLDKINAVIKRVSAPYGFYWLIDFFAEQEIKLLAYPTIEGDAYIYYVSNKTQTTEVKVNDTIREAYRQAFAAAFLILEKQIINQQNP